MYIKLTRDDLDRLSPRDFELLRSLMGKMTDYKINACFDNDDFVYESGELSESQSSHSKSKESFRIREVLICSITKDYDA